MTTDGKDRTSARCYRCGRLTSSRWRLAESAERRCAPAAGASVAATSSGTAGDYGQGYPEDVAPREPSWAEGGGY